MNYRCVLRSQAVRAGLVAAGLLAFSTTGFAHGGVSMEKDMCKLSLGPYVMHFAGYQVTAGLPDTEFCEDIPSTGKTIIVMDALDQALRSLPVKVQILTGGTGGNVVVELPAKTYPSGSVSVEYTFEHPGNFVGLVTAGEHGEYTSRFPFSVGIAKRPYALYGLLTMVGIAAASLYWYSGSRRTKAAGVERG